MGAVLVGCSSTRRIEQKAHREVYESLGVKESRHDNFALYKEAASWLNTPHVERGLTRGGIDCSGLVSFIKMCTEKPLNAVRQAC